MIYWGDGRSSGGTPIGNEISGSHTYAQEGPYGVVVAIRATFDDSECTYTGPPMIAMAASYGYVFSVQDDHDLEWAMGAVVGAVGPVDLNSSADYDFNSGTVALISDGDSQYPFSNELYAANHADFDVFKQSEDGFFDSGTVYADGIFDLYYFNPDEFVFAGYDVLLDGSVSTESTELRCEFDDKTH